MKTIDRGRTTALLPLAVVGLLAVVSQWSLVWHHAVGDIDTDTFIGYAGTESCQHAWIVKGMGDSAHPLGNWLLLRWVCGAGEAGFATPAQAWFLLIGAAILVMSLLLMVVAHRAGGGAAAAAVALGFLGTSPVLRTLSARAEEDWIGTTLLLVVAVSLMSHQRMMFGSRARLVAVSLSTLVLAVWHSQYLLVLVLGLVPWGLVALARPSIVGATRRKVLSLAAAMALPVAAAYGLLFGSGYAVRVEYQRMYFSIFNPAFWTGPVDWCRNYLAYSSRWLTGWLGNDGMEEKLFPAPQPLMFALLGLVAIVLFALLVISSRSSLLMALAFGSFVLPFLYEPHNAERWAPAAGILALALAHGTYLRPGRERRARTADGAAEAGVGAEPAPATTHAQPAPEETPATAGTS